MPVHMVQKKGVGHFIEVGLWELNPDSYTGLRRAGVKYLQILALVIKDFNDDQCLLRASSLAFTTILSMVPFFALTFAVLKGFGVQNRLEPFILEQVAAGSQEVVSRVVSYINNTNMASLGTFGLLTLIVTVISLLGSVEEAFNVIWGVKETRPLKRKFSDYLSVVISGPVLLFTATSLTTSLHSQDLVKWLLANAYIGDLLLQILQLAPYVSIWIAMVFLYIFIPNTQVRFRSALVGGVLAGTVWQLAQWGYIHFQVGVAKYNAIYGTLAVLPVFMVWIYASWVIVLLGVEVVYAHQNIRTFRREVHAPGLSHRLRELLALAVLNDVTVAFATGSRCWSAPSLAEDLDLPVRQMQALLGELTTAGFLVTTSEEPPCYQPARDPGHILVSEVLHHLREAGGQWRIETPSGAEQRLQKLLERLDCCVADNLDGMTLQQLALQTESETRLPLH
jgi:membrane protein